MISGPLGFYTVLNTLITSVNDELAGTLGGQPDRACVVPGLIAWDECDCGLLAGTITQQFYTDNFPQPNTGAATSIPCQSSFIAAEMMISLIRCAPNPHGNQLAPPCAELDAAAQIWTVDAHILQQTVFCTLEEMRDNNDIVEYLVSNLVSAGPEGGCVGSDITFTVGLDNV